MSDDCLLVLARAGDVAIRALQTQARQPVVHASIPDLSCAGWRYVSGRPDQASVYASGRVIPAARIAAVLCRLDTIAPSDLPHVHRDDRAYVAAELNAFLRAWLTQFRGVRFNEPSWVSLAGPGWDALQWAWFVRRLGVPVAASAHRSTELRASGREIVRVIVAGDDVFGITDPTLATYALRIARATRSCSLRITFIHDHRWQFVSADPRPDIDSVSASALLRLAFASDSAPTSREGGPCLVM
jgi:hypothetical protein